MGTSLITSTTALDTKMILPLIVAAIPLLSLVDCQHFFGPPAIGFGAALVGQQKKLQVATSIVSRRSSRSYSQTSFIKATPSGVTGYRTSTYTATDHYKTANHISYYQPNQYHYHSTPWSYRWGRSADLEARERREAKLEELGDINTIPASSISRLAANVSIAYQPQVWANDMVYKDQDDCSKRLLCELNAKLVDGKDLTENERIIANAFGQNSEIDIGAETLEFDLAAVLGKEGGMRRCELSYGRCETPVADMVNMINMEVEELEIISKELEQGAVNIGDIDNRLDEEDEEVQNISLEDLTKVTTTTTKPNSYWWIENGISLAGSKL